MYEWYPILIILAVISMFTTVFILAYALMKDKKEAIGYDRNMKDREIIKRLAPYLLRRKKLFILALALVLLSTVYSICAPAILGRAVEIISSQSDFAMTFSVFHYAK